MRVVIVPVFCLIALAQCNQPPYFLMLLGPIPLFIRSISEKAREGCPGHLENYSVARNESVTCFRSSNAGFITLCNEFQKNVERCSKPVIDFYTECLPEKSKDLPQIFIKGVVSLNKFICEGKDNPEIEAGFQNVCILNALSDEYQESKCLKTVTRKTEKFVLDLPTRSEACQFVDGVRTCIQESVDEKCQNPVARKFYSKFMNAALSECRNNHTLSES